MDKGEATAPASERLFSLDALRGLDMILLTVVGPLVCAAQKGWACFSPGFMRQFGHGWECFTLWDIIMPLFIFMCGAAVPLALERRLKDGAWVFWRHVLGRVALLWVLGGLVQGRWTAHIFGDGVAAHLPQSASPFVLALLEVIVLVAVLSIWRAAKKGYAAQQFLKRK